MAARDKDPVDALPYQLGIRLILDNVSYSNPLPDWFDAPNILYAERERIVKRRIKTYLDHRSPEPALGIKVPRKSGDVKLWAMPSVNDQIICQVCVSSIAAELSRKCVDPKTVFSYNYRTDVDSLELCVDSITSWKAFQDETKRRCKSGDCILQIDLRDAFRSIKRVNLISFLRRLFPDRIEVGILDSLLTSFSNGDPGLPLVNDSIFFIGNAYLSVVDAIVARYSKNFIRFVDDYRIFSPSREELSRLPGVLAPPLSQLGLKINAGKQRLLTGEEYLESLAQVIYATTQMDGVKEEDNSPEEYLKPRPVVINGVLTPDKLMDKLHRALDNPQSNLNEGNGRYLMGALRRARLDERILKEHSDGDNDNPALRKQYSRQMSRDNSLMEKVDHFLNYYAARPDELWRLTWLLYLSKDIDFGKVKTPHVTSIQRTLLRIRTNRSSPPLAQLWATNNNDQVPALPKIEQIHERSYIDGGRLFLLGG